MHDLSRTYKRDQIGEKFSYKKTQSYNVGPPSMLLAECLTKLSCATHLASLDEAGKMSKVLRTGVLRGGKRFL